MTTNIPGFIANGQMPDNIDLLQRVRACHPIIAVDGGLNHCDRLGIKPSRIVGDFDSVAPDLLEKYSSVQRISLARAKDKTDLEAALDGAQIEKVAFCRIFAALGGRLDHSLYNIYLLLRHPGKIFLETADEVLFAVKGGIGKVTVDCSQHPYLSIIPFYEDAHNISVQGENFQLMVPRMDREKTVFTVLSSEKKVTIETAKGEILLILHKSAKDLPPLEETDEISYEFTIETSFRQTLHLLQKASLEPRALRIESKNEIIIPLNEKTKKLSVACVPGQTISLIPLNGETFGITTKGLKWELKGHSMSKDFLGVSNVCMGREFSVEIQRGQLLCIIDKEVVDTKMINLVDHTTTGALTQATVEYTETT